MHLRIIQLSLMALASFALLAPWSASGQGKDVEEGWVKADALVGYDPGPYEPKPDRTWSAQRGLHYPQPPAGSVPDSVGFPD